MTYPTFVSKSLDYHSVNLKDDTLPQSKHCGENDAKQIQRQTSAGTWQDIAWNTFFLTFPMLLLTCTLFTFIFAYRVTSSTAPYERLSGLDKSSQLGEDVYFVDLNSTFLIFIASWMSSLAPMLAGFAIALAAYPVVGRLYEDTMQHNKERLLTPFQLHLTLRLITGSTWSALLNMLQYRLGRNKGVRHQGVALTSLCNFTCMVVPPGTFVFGADTWLHITTKTVSITQLTHLNNGAAPYSLSLISPNYPGSALLASGASVFQTLNNQSNISVLNDGPDSSLAYLTVTPSNRRQRFDFSATTFGMRTTCQPIASACNGTLERTQSGSLVAWNCTSGQFAGGISEQLQFRYSFYQDESLTTWGEDHVSKNPFYYAVATMMLPSAKPLHNLDDDPEVLAGMGLMGIVLRCAIEVFDVEYDVVEGNVTGIRASPSNISVINVFQPALDTSGFGAPSIQSAFSMATAVAKSAQDLADMFSLSFSKITLSVSAGCVTPTPALVAQSRDSILVAKVYKAPLFLLAGCNLAFVVMGVVLAVTAARSSPEAREVQARLSISGVVAYMFDPDTARAAGMEQSVAGETNKLFAEHYDGEVSKRVGVGRGDVGGFEFKTLEPDECVTSSVIWGPTDEKRSTQDNGYRPGWI